jgi:hypothetical protein
MAANIAFRQRKKRRVFLTTNAIATMDAANQKRKVTMGNIAKHELLNARQV